MTEWVISPLLPREPRELGRPVDVLLDDRVLDVGPEARVREARAPLFC